MPQNQGAPVPDRATRASTKPASGLGHSAGIPRAAIGAFVRESNYIEGIEQTTDAHIVAHLVFLGGPVCIPALVELVSVLQPNARFRNCATVSGVRVGNHIAPPSGPHIEDALRRIIAMRDPWEQHIAYETLHPFTDGNGRSGRAIWLHRHYHEGIDPYAVQRGFLHSFYYHTLSGVRLASAIEAASAGETTEIGSTEGESAIGASRDAQKAPPND